MKMGKPDLRRFTGTADDIEPMRLKGTRDLLTEQERADNAAHDQALQNAFTKDR